MEFDENQAVQYIRERLEPQFNALIDNDDEILNVIDIIFDYYEANGLLDIDADDADDDVDLQDLADYVGRMLRKDRGAKFPPEAIAPAIAAYMEYENLIDE